MLKSPHDAMDFRIVKVDDLHDAGLEKQIDQRRRGVAVILGIGPTYRKLPSIRADRPNVHVQATLMALVRSNFAPPAKLMFPIPI